MFRDRVTTPWQRTVLLSTGTAVTIQWDRLSRVPKAERPPTGMLRVGQALSDDEWKELRDFLALDGFPQAERADAD